MSTNDTYERRTRIPAPTDQVFAWHEREGALERLTPPWERVRVVDREGGIADGGRVTLAIKRGPAWLRWEALHRDFEKGRQFVDEQVRGPFRAWRHTHRFHADDTGGTVMEDHIDYRLPGGPLGRLLGGRSTRRTLERTFAYRHRRLEDDLARHAAFADRGALKIAITGASGLVGKALVPFLTTGGHVVRRLVRKPAGEGEIRWDPAKGEIDAAALEGFDAVIHLAGENVAEGRWTERKKHAIRESRVAGTRLLCEALAKLERQPRVLIAASAIGWYGDRPEEEGCLESDAPGAGFLADVCVGWEQATRAAFDAGIRVVNLRIGLVLSASGGPLAKMLTPFRMGAGGRIGSGRQPMSWIAIDDLVGAIHHLIFADGVSGPVNAVSPNAVSNLVFTKTLGRVLGRPTIAPLPAFAVRLIFGEMGQALLLGGARVLPARLTASGYRFRYPLLEHALRAELGLEPGGE